MNYAVLLVHDVRQHLYSTSIDATKFICDRLQNFSSPAMQGLGAHLRKKFC